MEGLTRHIDSSKKLVCEVFGAHGELGSYALMFHLLDHLVACVALFCTLQLLNTSAVEQYNVHIESAYRSISRGY